MRRTTVYWLLAASLGALLASCSDQREPIGSPHAHGKAFLDRASPAFHGSAQTRAALDCAQCHELAEKCFECHFGPGGERVPAGVAYTHGVIPHDQDALKDVGAVCDRCHELTQSFRNEPTTCHKCHEGRPAPHPMGRDWIVKSASFHGNDATLDCALCHEEGTFCSTCHFDAAGSRVPGGVTGWTHGEALRSHAAANLFTNDQRMVCTTCHGRLSSYGVGPTFTDCSTSGCHGFVYHGSGFFVGHPAAAHADLSTCRRCHDTPDVPPNFDGYVTAVACSGCHTAALAHPPPPATSPEWYETHRSAGGTRAAACGPCHRTDGPGAGTLPNAPSCFSASFGGSGCHIGGPGTAPHALGQAWLDPNQSTFHGANLALFPCQDCHDQNTFCGQCHFGPGGGRVPAGATWTHGRYPHDLTDLTARQAVCNQCHSLMEGFSGHPGRTDCANCHGIERPHGLPFQTAHRTQAAMDLALCQRCHGHAGTPEFSGGVEPEPVCTICHTDARAHPTPWRLAGGATVSHKDAANSPGACAICHDIVIDGTGTTPLPGAPACRTCHPTGFVPHAVPFNPPSLHGPAAKANLKVCQTCHADNPTGGAGSNPRFNLPIPAGNGSGLANGCEDCHTPGSAHATNWQGQDGNKRSHRGAGHLPDACNLCHGATLQGATAGGVVRPSCSTASFTNAEAAVTACHANGYLTLRPFHPAQGAWLPVHAGRANATCTAECHAANGTTTVNGIPGCGVCHFGPTGSRVPAGVTWTHGATPHDFLTAYAAVCNACHTLTNATTVTCTAACHAGAPHAVPFTAPALHGPAAKADLRVCQGCHSDNPSGGAGSNPRFDVSPPVPSGCETCHNDRAAHPATGGRDNYPWYDRTYTHGTAGNLATACALCHGAALQGGVGPACTSCHVASPATNPTGCRSCHNSPPNSGTPAGNVRPNRRGQHGGEHAEACGTCHTGAGQGTTAHFDGGAPANVQFAAGIAMTATQTATNTTCTGTCHDEGHDGRRWY